DNEQEEVDPNALEREVESDVKEESRHDEDEVEDDDEDDRYGTWRTESDDFHVRWPRVRVPVHDRDCLPVHAGRPGDRDCLPVYGSPPRQPREYKSVSYVTHNQKLHHELESAPTFRELFDRTHKQKGTDDYVSESAHTIAETYDRTVAERYAEGTPQPELDPEAWVDTAGGPRKGRVYGFGDSLDTHPVLSSYASSIASPAYVSSSTAPPVSGVEEIRDLIQEELRAQLQTQQVELQTQFGDMVQQLISAMQGVHPTQPAPQDPAPDDDEAGTADDPADLS
ncbi:hypothetical protein Taro_029278, partial [Colocasia esculenta]|nr:hypothetical protein [Colocasia esculenta]